MLTIQEIKNAKAGDKPRKLYDRDGLPIFERRDATGPAQARHKMKTGNFRP